MPLCHFLTPSPHLSGKHLLFSVSVSLFCLFCFQIPYTSGICLSLSKLFHLAYLLDPSMLLQMTKFHFYGWIIFHFVGTHTHIYTHIYVHIQTHIYYPLFIIHSLSIMNTSLSIHLLMNSLVASISCSLSFSLCVSLDLK